MMVLMLKLIFLLIAGLFAADSFCQDNVESNESHGEQDVFVRLENQFAVGNVTDENVVQVNVSAEEKNDNDTSSKNLSNRVKFSENNTEEFRPSLHLGEIEEYRIANSNLFNNLKAIKFENFISSDGDIDSAVHLTEPRKKNLNKYQYPYPEFAKATIEKNQNVNFRPNIKSEITFSAPAHFQNSPFPTSLSLISEKPNIPIITGNRPTYPESDDFQYSSTSFGKPSKFHSVTNYVTPYSSEVHGYEYVTPTNLETNSQPDVIDYPPGFHDSNNENLQRPETVGYHTFPPHETTFTKAHRFPYKFYQEPVSFQDTSIEYIEDGRPNVKILKLKSQSPWKKIIHLIGTFLPLGLLLAALTPNVVQIGNTTSPNIVLSKLRNVGMPVEHKSARMEDNIFCEEKSICEMILAGSKPKSNLLFNVLWNFSTRMSEEDATKNGLGELFEAVKKKNCNIIVCKFM
ncbi:uncharacterized protein LOC107267185 [Cephus cinctus]|uniref:Uncharacterized protein LOC107267185 n=1 Tax=Cephus cinctus TaxID=211228 RepID=A0AAJ7FIX4_CEPCN|nr:uncharacterized protein LOC107267185 [Cephus cinctus]